MEPESDGVAFYRNPSFFLQIHIVEHLSFHFSLRNGVSELQKSVCQGAFPMIYVCDYAKVSYVLHIIERSQKFNLISLTGKVTKKRAKTPKHGLNYPKTAIKYLKTLSFLKGLKHC